MKFRDFLELKVKFFFSKKKKKEKKIKINETDGKRTSKSRPLENVHLFSSL
jgi:hypothetical protein